MPWIDQNLCIHCGLCISACPVEAIANDGDDQTVIDMDKCIRCGECHEICPQGAVRHDSERIPQEVAANLEKTRLLLQYYADAGAQEQFLDRMIRHFVKEKKVAQATMEKLTDWKNEVSKKM